MSVTFFYSVKKGGEVGGIITPPDRHPIFQIFRAHILMTTYPFVLLSSAMCFLYGGWKGGGAYPDPGGEDDEDPVDNHEYGEEPQQDEPEPDEDVDLLIYWKKNLFFCNSKPEKLILNILKNWPRWWRI